MGLVIKMLPKKAHVMTGGVAATAHTAVKGFEPELPKEVWCGGIFADKLDTPDAKLKMREAEIEQMLSEGRLVLDTRRGGGEVVADRLHLDGNDFVSSPFFELLNELEPGVHRALAVQVISEHPIGGKTEHGIFYWLRPSPVIDCILFPRTKTCADIQRKRWDKIDRFTSVGLPLAWGGGVAFCQPAYIDAGKIEGHHYWWTRQGPGVTSVYASADLVRNAIGGSSKAQTDPLARSRSLQYRLSGKVGLVRRHARSNPEIEEEQHEQSERDHEWPELDRRRQGRRRRFRRFLRHRAARLKPEIEEEQDEQRQRNKQRPDLQRGCWRHWWRGRCRRLDGEGRQIARAAAKAAGGLHDHRVRAPLGDRARYPGAVALRACRPGKNWLGHAPNLFSGSRGV
jgi:hypothetical protein